MSKVGKSDLTLGIEAESPFSWSGRRVFITGHTGFKGSWLALWLADLGAVVRGYSLDPGTEPNMFNTARVGSLVEDIRGDIRDGGCLREAMTTFQPEIVFHLAAQPLVRYSYLDPIGTFETNVIGTARVLDTVRHTPSVRAIVSVTTDKCYENKEWDWPYRETDPLGGYDPYSSSKACAEIVSASFRQSYFPISPLNLLGDGLANNRVALATARAGNVIGGGDWSSDRLLPDLIRGFFAGRPVLIRNPTAIRPWQHVMEPLHGYITLAERLLTHNAKFATAFNFGPNEVDARPVSWIADRLVRSWGSGATWVFEDSPNLHEAGYLKLDSSRAKALLGWTPQLDLETALQSLVYWYKAWDSGEDMQQFTLQQIRMYCLRSSRLSRNLPLNQDSTSE